VRQSTLVTYLPIARALPSFRLRADAAVDRLAIEGHRARGVILADGQTIEADQVILAAGVFGTPMILMRSGIGPAAHLTDVGVDVIVDLPVGIGLQDHPALGLLAMADGPVDVDHALISRVMARHSFDGRAGEEDVHIFGPFTAEAVRAPIPDNAFVLAGFTTRPRSSGWVRLRSRDPNDPPRVMLNYFDEPDDLGTFIRMMLTIEEILLQPSIQKVADQVPWRPSREDRLELERAARAGALTDHHESGTCKIGPVLDPHLRVHGIDGLRVCDASVLPDTPRCNTNFPTMMVAERFIELLDGE
jgi:choline dehydrogenase